MKGKIFNAQEVQALIAGNKTQFREVIKPQPSGELAASFQKYPLILAITLALLPANALAECEKAKDMGASFYRCENKEAICYGLFIEDSLTSPQISCFKKLTKN